MIGDAPHQQAHESFNQRFWFEEGAYLYDVVDVDGGSASDAACRPNQLFAIALDNPVLNEARWKSVVDVAERELLTPVGLRSLSPKHPDLPIYGDLRSRDGAYHQGTVWAWLIGPLTRGGKCTRKTNRRRGNS
jgi:predicted glycogen debranching enzyme